MPQLPQEAAVNLSRFFGISIIQYAMLYACQRDDIINFGCDPQTISWAERVALHQLRTMGFVYFDLTTGHWELTVVGRTALKTVPDLVRIPVVHHGLAKVLPWKTDISQESRLTPNGATTDTVKHS